MAANPCTPGFNKLRQPGADVSAGTGKPSDLLVGHTQPLSLLTLLSRARYMSVKEVSGILFPDHRGEDRDPPV